MTTLQSIRTDNMVDTIFFMMNPPLIIGKTLTNYFTLTLAKPYLAKLGMSPTIFICNALFS